MEQVPTGIFLALALSVQDVQYRSMDIGDCIRPMAGHECLLGRIVIPGGMSMVLLPRTNIPHM